MLEQLSKDEFLVLAETSKRIAVFREILADRLTPVGIVENLEEEMRDGAILESGLQRQAAGRYSFITFGAMAQLLVKDKIVLQRIGNEVTKKKEKPFTVLRKLIARLSCAGKQHTANFITGAVGFMSYEAIRLFESIPDRHVSDQSFPEMLFNFYQTTLMFDHLQQKLTIGTIVDLETANNPAQLYQETQEKINQLVTKITSVSVKQEQQKQVNHANIHTNIDTDIDDVPFMKLVKRAKEYIVAGDAFQIVLSRCFKKRYSVTPFDIYRALRRVSPAPYMFYLPTDDGVIIGASPEKLVSVYNRQAEINPIAGTRPRTENSKDEQIVHELLNDEKELAEHMMLVDLARNDLGAVCKPGSIEVKELLQVKHFSHVSHITSSVTGQLQDGKDALDALKAAFPAGTLSGGPKIRAMEIIDELEISKRGMYGGAICRLDYQGNLDSCIAIRMAVLKDGIAVVRAGGGIVYDSDPQAEADENRQKAKAVLESIRLAEEGLA